jgi:DNA repair photolyase
MQNSHPKMKMRGRGAMDNPQVRFEKLDVVYEPEDEASQLPDHLKTQVFKDTSRSIITYNDSPDVGMEATLNAYRGCEHGCIYCFARPFHEYLGLSSGLDFETKIFAKIDAPELLYKALSNKNWQPKVVTMSGITDPYQPLEKKLEITRECLKIFAEFKNPISIITKNHLVTRDIDILSQMAGDNLASVNFSITSLDRKIARTMEPRASTPSLRLKAVKELTAAGIPVNVMMAPIIPGLTDHEIPKLLETVAEAGACNAGYVMLRLPYAVKHLFETWLEEHFPLRKDKVLNRLRSMRGGKLYDAKWGTRMRGEGFYAEQTKALFYASKKRYGLTKSIELTTEHFNNISQKQLSLF